MIFWKDNRGPSVYVRIVEQKKMERTDASDDEFSPYMTVAR